MSKFFEIICIILSVIGGLLGFLNGCVLISSVHGWLDPHIGCFSYTVAVPLSAILAPAVFFFLPWFDAWAHDSAVNERIFWIWASFGISIILLMLFSLLAALTEKKTSEK